MRDFNSCPARFPNTVPVYVGTDDHEALEPLRQRYSAQHYALRKFYYECSNLKYLTSLINVPKLGQVSIGVPWFYVRFLTCFYDA